MTCKSCDRLKEYFINEVNQAEENREILTKELGPEAFKLLYESALNAKRVVLAEITRGK
jgi:hypothetical protein